MGQTLNDEDVGEIKMQAAKIALENQQLKARIARLEQHVKLVIAETDSHAYIGSTAQQVVGSLHYQDLKLLVNESPQQSLVAIQADAVEALRFPTMLRKMWSGTEVDNWLKEQSQSLRDKV